MRVLLVDDDELVRSVITEALCDAGFEVTSFACPEEALSLPSGHGTPGVVVTDIDLGLTLNGFDVADGARQRWPNVRIILISGLPATHTGQTLNPRDRYLQKPFCNDDLVRTINELVTEAGAG